MKTPYYLTEIQKERARQDEKWGEQNHHPLMWFSIIGEEYGEMLKAFNEYSFDNDFNHFEDMQREAIQIAASCVAMLECIDRMADKGYTPEGGKKE
jgi:NTP pyrophosphatase (non-canonical NTP hydrolase)